MINTPRSIKLDEAIGGVLFGNQRNFFIPIISQIGQYVALLHIKIDDQLICSCFGNICKHD